VDGIKWNENIWSKGLCYPLPGNAVDQNKYDIYTATIGNVIHNSQDRMYYRFHGSPDLTIVKKQNQEEYILIDKTSATDIPTHDCKADSPEIYGIVEDSIKNEPYIDKGDVTVVQKVGELLSNMHVVLFKKMLTQSRKKDDVNSFTVHGMLLTRQEGLMLCKLEMPVVDLSGELIYLVKLSLHKNCMINFNICLTMESSLGGLTKDIICSTIR